MTRHLRCGFTLVEVLVAVLLVDIALLAMIGASAVVVKRQTEARTRIAASQAAANRLQLLAAGPCGGDAESTVSGTATGERGIVERWRVDRRGNNIRAVHDSVSWLFGGVPRALVLRTEVAC